MPLTPAPVHAPPPSTLVVSETILGFGSHGTVVFRGSLQGRSVAVKRLLRDFVTLASREVSILQESDDHPNVIRYYYQETHANFLYIALELCPGSLADVYEGSGDINLAFAGLDACEGIDSKEEWREIRESIIADPKKALKQITSGLRHLHALKLVHRDIKPQNILVAAGPGRNLSTPSSASLSRGQNKSIRGPSYRMLISDFGLCKKLDFDQTSFLPTAQGAMGAGTFGWRAPEILRGEVKLDNSEDTNSSKGSAGTVNGNPPSVNSSSSTTSSINKPTRLTKSVDIFALGCLFYYMLTGGGHPFGDRFEREINIIKGVKDITTLGERYGEEGVDAADLIEKMLNPDSSLRPDTSSCLLHPFFWDSGRRLNFLQDASDRFEIMCRDPKDPHLIELEKDAFKIVGHDWQSRVDKVFIESLGKFRKYDGKSVQDLLRALRNKKHHYQDLPGNVKRHLGPLPEGYLSYFTRRYPQLFLHTHRAISESELHSEPMFRTYFELVE
ncbi:other IRE protein kinase [Lentinula edodes]|uniref:non-specific serine/threonine protein kinase n=1 Tax=Lentinula edodes TaxID=5353 RepID=A0A1Q3DX94_LENED|nr:other IRE protein kinase [Lentinula edodes]